MITLETENRLPRLVYQIPHVRWRGYGILDDWEKVRRTPESAAHADRSVQEDATARSGGQRSNWRNLTPLSTIMAESLTDGLIRIKVPSK